METRVQTPLRLPRIGYGPAASRSFSLVRAGTDGKEQSIEVLAARTTRPEVRGDSRIAASRLGPGAVVKHEFDVDVEEAERLVAPHVARVGSQELLQLGPPTQGRSSVFTCSVAPFVGETPR